jgi:hypothetical protein
MNYEHNEGPFMRSIRRQHYDVEKTDMNIAMELSRLIDRCDPLDGECIGFYRSVMNAALEKIKNPHARDLIAEKLREYDA